MLVVPLSMTAFDKVIYFINPPVFAAMYMLYGALKMGNTRLASILLILLISAVLYAVCWIVFLYTMHLCGVRS